jgi:carbon storage regulator
MLVLTRKLMEKLFIGDDICVTVVRLEGGQVRLGIEAPRDVTVVRAELVPERVGAGPRPRLATQPQPHSQAQGHPDRPPVRIPPASAHGNGIRRPGRSR